MMTGIFLRRSTRLIFCLLILGFSSTALLSQTDSVVVNKYARVLSRSDYQVVVDDASAFNNGDTVLIIQMQGVAINTADALGYGTTVEQKVGVPGRYEFLIIQTVVPAAKTISFFTKINKYDPAGSVQIIKVPYFDALSQSKVLTCKKWDRITKTGGVLAMFVGKTLTLNNNIDVSGKGFSGGKDTIGLGNCSDPSGILNKYSFPRSFQNAGYKGEGLASHQSPCPTCTPVILPLYLKGQGAFFSGGGGGNGKFSGGGGGSNRGLGGQGGKEFYLCSSQINTGGYPGVSVTGTQIDTITGGIFMGGGGGSSTGWAGSVFTAGGNGGGIVIIVADQMNGNGNKIVANGISVSTAKLDAGAGGGGAGGSVIISSNSILNTELSVKGGNGGNHLDGFGEGGGGGGGLLWISQPSKPVSVINTLNGGTEGIDTILVTTTASPGLQGLAKYNFIVQLNGFLFNAIRSSTTGNQIDSVCSNMIPPKIIGTTPVGGTPGAGYIIKWEKSYDLSTWITLINDPDPTNYTPAAPETSTVYYRRTVTDHSLPSPIVDISRPVQIIVHSKIQNNNIVANPDTICFNGDPQLLKQGLPDLIVPTIKYLKYIWQDSTVGGVWSPELAAETVKEFDPNPVGGLTKDTWYRRTVVSGSCIDKGSGSIAKITVLSKLNNNAFSKLYDTICFGGNTNLNTITGPTGGLSTDYRYKWESSSISSTGPWTTVAGAVLPIYDPDASSSLPVGDHFYRRIVFSGEQDACKDTTKPAAIRKVWPPITNNLIKTDQIVGYDSIPLKLTDSLGVTLGGNGINYTYLWVKDTVAFPHAPTGANGILNSEYQPPNLKYTISFRRIVNSSACSNTSNSVKIKVDLPITNTVSLANNTLDTIYTGQVSSKLNGSLPTGGSGISNDYSFKWYASHTGSTLKSEWTLISDSTGINLYPGNLIQTTWFRRDVSSPKLAPRSTYQSNYLKVTVLPKITNVEITANESVCYGRRPLQLKGSSSLTGGDGKYKFTWQDSTSAHIWRDIANFVKNDSANFKPPALIADSWYKRIVYSGKNNCGVEISNTLLIKVNPLPGVPYAGPDTIINSILNNYQMKANKPLAGETGAWSILNNTTTSNSFINPSVYNTEVRNLSVGKNSFIWTVDNGLCKLSDSVNIVLLKDFFPQGFSPNGDSHNDTFIIEGLNLVDNYADLIIVNGAGTEVFKTSNRNNQKWTDWDGKNSAGIELPQGTYYYMLKIVSKLSNGPNSKRSGFIVLKRY
ncbi:MAG: gliding motility-associated C-terminal domain-containing protein [Bacteroidales bacterium]